MASFKYFCAKLGLEYACGLWRGIEECAQSARNDDSSK